MYLSQVICLFNIEALNATKKNFALIKSAIR